MGFSFFQMLGQGCAQLANWWAGRSLAHFFFATRYFEKDLAYWRDKCERAEREIAEQAGRFAVERKDLLDRFTVSLQQAMEQETPKPKDKDLSEWEELANGLGLNPIARTIRRQQLQDEQTRRELWEQQLVEEELQKIRRQTVGDLFDEEAERERLERIEFDRLAQEAALNKAGGV